MHKHKAAKNNPSHFTVLKYGDGNRSNNTLRPE